MTDSDSDDGTLPPLLGSLPLALPAPPPSGSAPAAEETPGALVPVKRGRGRPPGSRNEPKTNPGSPQQSTRENNKKKRREVTKHKAEWVKEELTSTVHEFKGEPPGSTRRVTDRHERPMLSPIEYFHQFITDEMLKEIVESTNAHLHATLGKENLPPWLSCGSKMATSLGESLEGPHVGGDQEVPLGVLYGLGAGKNTRMSIKDMLSEDEFSWATHVPWLKKHGVTEKWLTHMFMNMHLQPNNWPDLSGSLCSTRVEGVFERVSIGS